MLANGESVRASADENPDLFWAIRGGGGNFGVVTSFLFRLHEVGTIVGGPTFWPVEQRRRGAARLPRLPADAPRELNGFFAFTTRCRRRRRSPRSCTCSKVCGVVWCYVGDPRRTPPRRWRRCSRRCPSRSCTASQRDAAPGPAGRLRPGSTRPATSGTGGRTSSSEIPDEAVAEPRRASAPQMPTWQSTMHLYPIDGAAHDVGASDTAWAYRDATLGDSVFAGVDPDPANAETITRLERRLLRGAPPLLGRRRLREHDDGRGSGAGAGELRATTTTASRASRRQYDPGNLFRVNQNIRPA